ncbi:hypothetical protein [Parahaliea mediterranea]|uniref:FHA domain-containing protein n=1 Tax=Parahaliea mediterranea TaxID=651086 RepID=A0A939DCN0_9GAMM|nr:hypothetical protein [Parahaliea mediterranea]MBN7795625.1 hypothetical protein [Parahaliea mediterranea]
MAIALLDINDCNLQLWHGEHHVQSPGYALWEDGEYRFGTAARAAARLRPRDVATRYWAQLGTRPLQPALGPARHSADLVHAHLLALHREAGEPEEVVLAVPGSMEREQLALLLGIIEQCPFRAVGLANRSVALAQPAARGRPLYHLEFQLHQALLTRLEDTAGERRLGRVQPLAGCGLLQLQERLVEIIAAAFIRQTRFDPRRQAASEQSLYDALPAALAELRREGEARLEVAGYSARLAAAALAEAGERLFKSVADAVGHEPVHLLADPLTALLPGAETSLSGLHILEGEHLRHTLPAFEAQVIRRDAPLVLVNALPLSGDHSEAAPPAVEPEKPPARSAVSTEPPVAPAGPVPTHLLQGFRARTLRATGTDLGAGWELYRADGAWLLRGPDSQPATVNGQPYTEGRHIHCGDTLAVAGALAGVVIEVGD